MKLTYNDLELIDKMINVKRQFGSDALNKQLNTLRGKIRKAKADFAIIVKIEK